jgi:hypothetical protein
MQLAQTERDQLIAEAKLRKELARMRVAQLKEYGRRS